MRRLLFSVRTLNTAMPSCAANLELFPIHSDEKETDCVGQLTVFPAACIVIRPVRIDTYLCMSQMGCTYFSPHGSVALD